MPETIEITINDRAVSVPAECTVAAAILIAGVTNFRRSVGGEPRAPLCGMGVCYECRVTIDEHPHARSCQTPCRAGMIIKTDA